MTRSALLVTGFRPAGRAHGYRHVRGQLADARAFFAKAADGADGWRARVPLDQLHPLLVDHRQRGCFALGRAGYGGHAGRLPAGECP